jgi:hypothetical protein
MRWAEPRCRVFCSCDLRRGTRTRCSLISGCVLECREKRHINERESSLSKNRLALYRSFRRGRPHHDKENVWLSRKVVGAWPRSLGIVIYARLITRQKDMRLKASASRCLARPSMEKAVSQWGIDQAGFPLLVEARTVAKSLTSRRW